MSVRRAVDRYIDLYRRATPRERRLLLDAVTPGREPDQLDPLLWGPTPTSAQNAATALALLQRRFADRRALAERSLTRVEAAELLGLSTRAATRLLAGGHLVGFKAGRRWFIPAWQFAADQEHGYLPGLAQLARVFPGGPVSLSEWVSRPSPELGRRRPREVLAAGEVDAVVRVARELTAAGW